MTASGSGEEKQWPIWNHLWTVLEKSALSNSCFTRMMSVWSGRDSTVPDRSRGDEISVTIRGFTWGEERPLRAARKKIERRSPRLERPADISTMTLKVNLGLCPGGEVLWGLWEVEGEAGFACSAQNY